MKTETILQCLSETLQKPLPQIQNLDPNTELTELGMTSLSFIAFIVKIEEALGIEVLDSDLIFENFSTLHKLFQTLAKYFPNQAPIKKVLVLDADNVLWRGVAGEESIVIDQSIIQFQRLCIALYERGVLLCLCSKNQLHLIEQAFASLQMLLKKEHFAVLLANEKDKASNLYTIADELNLSPDSFVFADDSDYELGFIALNFPEVECVKIDHAALSDACATLSALFEHVQPTSELNRTQLYREQKEREKEKHRFTSVQEYNASLQTKVCCQKATADDCARLSELSARTHQFNLSGKQYTPEELQALLNAPDHLVLSLSVQDKYGDMGTVGMAVVQGTTIEAFMLSCRVFDRDLELVLLNEIKQRVGKALQGVYLPTDKNRRFEGFYSDNGVIVI